MTVALDIFPAPWSEVTATALFFAPAVVPVTFTEKVHEPLAASVSPVSETVPDPGAAVIVPPPQVPVWPLGVDTTKPNGRVSVKPMPLSVTVVFEFVIVKIRLVLPFRGMVAEPKIFVMIGEKTPGPAVVV
ncbi:MAG: hypothetical protein M3Z32_00560, partial [Acidobacteriota bacterium]|nr:hypothetical protein [Acidobacteriota bacterium]